MSETPASPPSQDRTPLYALGRCSPIDFITKPPKADGVLSVYDSYPCGVATNVWWDGKPLGFVQDISLTQSGGRDSGIAGSMSFCVGANTAKFLNQILHDQDDNGTQNKHVLLLRAFSGHGHGYGLRVDGLEVLHVNYSVNVDSITANADFTFTAKNIRALPLGNSNGEQHADNLADGLGDNLAPDKKS